MDIYSLRGVDTDLYKKTSSIGSAASGNSDNDLFSTLLDSAIHNISETNSYLSDAENEKLRFAMGEVDNTHDLTIALQKASTALQYTIAIRDKMIEAYNKITQIQV